MIARYTLSCLDLPSASGLLRDYPRRVDHKAITDDVWRHYDRSTLVYDVVHLAGAGVVRLYLPRMLNLGVLLANAGFALDGRPGKPLRHRVYRRFETMDLRCSTANVRTLGLILPQLGRFDLPVSTTSEKMFSGRRVIYTLLHNENLEWVQDWMLFHNRMHGADAALIADNGSSSYTSEQLLHALQAVQGYDATAVLSVPLPWGPRGRGRGVDDGKFLQTTLLNLTRDRFFGTACGVLNLDVDEILLRRREQSAFDKAGRLGFVTFPGEWRYPADDKRPVRHRDHRFFDPADKPCATKYCYRPRSFFGRMCLSVHGLERVNRKLFLAARDFVFLHCRNISTSWKYDRLKVASPRMQPDSEAAKAFDSVFDERRSHG